MKTLVYRQMVAFLLAALLLVTFSLPAATPDYAVVISDQTYANPDWRKVAAALVDQHQASVIRYNQSITEAVTPLRMQFPRYACFVARPEEASREWVAQIHRLIRNLDDDPYADCFWGIVTGYDAASALRLAQSSPALTIRKVASATELAMEMVEEGRWYCELTPGKRVQKEPGQSAVELKGPNDTTEALVQSLNRYQADLFVASGHATEHDWQIGFRYKNGCFKHQDGRLYGLDLQGKQFPIDSPNPKVYLPIGNCLMGHIDRHDCMATAWMKSAGVRQMLGYTQPTWYGYMGWGVLDFFVEQPGRYTLTEAFLANHHALIHRLVTYFPDLIEATADARGRTSVRPILSEKAKVDGLTLNDARGLVFDRDVVAFYGDPAWSARMAERPKAFEQSLSVKDQAFTFEIKPQRGADSFKPINTNGSQRGGRPFIAYLPYRVRDIKILEGAELNPLITDNFILVPNPRVCDPTRNYRVRFSAHPIQ